MNVVRRLSILVSVALIGPALVVTGSQQAAAQTGQPAADVAPVPTKSHVVDEPTTAPSDASDPAWSDPQVTLPEPTTVEVDVPATGWSRAGSTPVSVGPPSGGVAASRVRVRVLSQSEVAAVGGRFLGFEVTRADGVGSAASVSVSVDYSGIAKAYGGPFATRLRLVRATTCVPGAPCSPSAMAAANEVRSGRLRAMNVVVRSDPTVASGPEAGSGFGAQSADAEATLAPLTSGTYTMMSGAGGESGNFAATPLTASDTWNVGVGSGAFTYSYPFKVPPAVAGPSPALSLNYNSQAVDGRNSVENGQPSQVGEGWSFNTGFIERKFHSCVEEGKAQDDLCWSANNEYLISFQGRSAEIVRTSASSNEWRVRGNDPGWRIRSFTACCSNGDNDGEYFVVITPDGTKYWFGYGIEPRNPEIKYTKSAWTVPVYGGSGEPCYSAVAAASWCQQAWRWNVDRILDTNDNVTSLFYAKETNRYSRHRTTTLSTAYDRGGYLTWIEYGQRHLAEGGTAYARVEFTMGERCITQVNCPAPTPGSPDTSYPDIPLDQWCTSATACAADQTAPTFWSTKTYTRILTEITDVSPAQYETVSIYRLAYSFPATGNPNSSPSLWLTDIEHTGEWGVGSTALPAVRMTGIAMQNRVNVPTGGDPIFKYRITSISTELGARVEVTYGTPDPCPSPSHPTWDANPYDCYPVRLNGQWSPFHKYLVTDLKTVDVRGAQPDRNAHYTYTGGAAWHYADSILATADNSPQSWSDYRGYTDVRVVVDGDSSSSQTDTRYKVFRGMQGDRLENGTARNVPDLVDSTGAAYNDFDYRAGLTLEVRSVDPGGIHLASSLFRYWSQQTVNGPNAFQSHDATFVRTSRVVQRVKNVDTAAWRDHFVDYTYDTAAAAPLTVHDQQMPGTSGDDTCVKQAYTHNTATGTAGGDTEWIVNRPYWAITYGGDCASTTIIARQSIYYDGQAFQAAPVDGNVTQVSDYITATTAAVTKTDYDGLGRVISVISPDEVAAGTNGATTTTFAPTTGYPANGITVTTPKASTNIGAISLTTTTVLYSAFGTPRSITDPNGHTTVVSVDHLGRTASVSRPDDLTGMPSQKFEYIVAAGSHNRVKSYQLVDDSTYVTSYSYFDGMGRLLQTQERNPNGTAGKRLITMLRYDALGRKAAETQPFYAAGDAGIDGLKEVTDLTKIPFETRYAHDSSGRLRFTKQYALGLLKITNETEYHGWHHVVNAPVRADADYHTDVAGRVTKIVERPTPTTSTTTTYAYSRLGDLVQITDGAANITTHAYDWLGRRTASTDPDQGTWLTSYTAGGAIQTIRDAKLDTLYYEYDRLGRKTAEREDSATGSVLAEWTYDTLGVPNATGRLTSATTKADGDHTVAVTGYDDRGRVTGKRWDIPGFPTSFSYGYTYNRADALATVTMPAVGGLAAETVTTEFNSVGLPTGLVGSIGTTRFIDATTYRDDGRLAQRNLVGGLIRTFSYDLTANRLQATRTTAPVGSPPVAEPIEDLTYDYDADSNVTSIADTMAGEDGVAQTECFGYDPLNRLTRAFTTNTACPSATPVVGTDSYDLTFEYDAIGNITRQTSGGSSPLVYDYTATNSRPHAPGTIGGKQYAFDDNGAMTRRPADPTDQTLVWNKSHQLKSVSGPGASSFNYDAQGNRLVRTTGTTKTAYLDGMEVMATGTTVTAKRYYGGVAVRSAAGVTVLLRNMQNSTSTAFDTVTGQITHQRYTPFGARRGAAALSATERRFLDKTEDATGLTQMGARYYDAAIGRFLSVDPLALMDSPQTLASYSYAGNNPSTFADPSGLVLERTPGGGCAGTCPRPDPNPTPTPTPTPPPPPGGTGGGGGWGIDPWKTYRNVMEAIAPVFGVPGFMAVAAINDVDACVTNGDAWACGRTAVTVVSVGTAGAVARGANAARLMAAEAGTTGARGTGLRGARQAYVDSARAIADDGAAQIAAGADASTVARGAVDARNALKLTAREGLPRPVRIWAEWRNTRLYDDPVGPSYDHLIARGKLPEQIVEGAGRTSGWINWLMGVQ